MARFELSDRQWALIRRHLPNKPRGVREAVIRSLLYIGMAGPGADERAFAVLRQIRAEHSEGMSLQAFKAAVREQYFALLLDPEGALAAIPRMLAADPALRKEAFEAISRLVSASGTPEGGRTDRLQEINRLFATEP